MRDEILYDMFTTIKVLTFLIIVCSIVILSIKVCESGKREIKSFKDILRLLDSKNLLTRFEKPKKESKQLNDFKVHYIDIDGQSNRYDRNNHLHTSHSQPVMHTLVPLPLPVHLPLPAPQPKMNIINPLPVSLPLPIPLVKTLIKEHHLHHHHVHHHHEHTPPDHSLAQASTPIIRPEPQPIIIHQRFNPLYNFPMDSILNGGFEPMQMSMAEPIPDQLVFPVFQKIESDDRPTQPKRNKAHRKPVPNSEIDDTVSKSAIDSNYRNNNNNRYIHRNRNNSLQSHNSPKEDDSHEWRTSSGLRLVNTDKFKAITRELFGKEYDNEDNNWFRKSVQSDRDYEEEKRKEFFDKKLKEIEANEKNERNGDRDKDRDSLDSRDNRRVHPKPAHNHHNIPKEHAVGIADDWTFKDVDLWVVR